MNHEWAYKLGYAAAVVSTYWIGGYGGAVYQAYYTYIATGSTTQAVAVGLIAAAQQYAGNYANTGSGFSMPSGGVLGAAPNAASGATDIVGTFVRSYANAPASPFTTAGGNNYWINQEPAEITEMRNSHPGWRIMEEEAWKRSAPTGFGLFVQKIPGSNLTGGAREHVMFVFQSDSSPDRLRYELRVAVEKVNGIEGTFLIPHGYRLFAMFHTHPFVIKSTLAVRGPSDDADLVTARKYVGAFHYIQALGPARSPYPTEWYYYGERAVP